MERSNKIGQPHREWVDIMVMEMCTAGW